MCFELSSSFNTSLILQEQQFKKKIQNNPQGNYSLQPEPVSYSSDYSVIVTLTMFFKIYIDLFAGLPGKRSYHSHRERWPMQ